MSWRRCGGGLTVSSLRRARVRARADAGGSRGRQQAPNRVASHMTALAGQGVQAVVGIQEVLVGTPRLFEESGIALDSFRERIWSLEQQGKSVIMVASNGACKGALGVMDQMRKEEA